VIAFSLKGLLGRKLRTSLTAIAIVLGVAMISGTFVLTDSIDKAFNTIFTDVRQGSNAVISGKSAFDLTDQAGSTAPTLDESLLEKVRAVPGVAEAEGSVDGEAQLIGRDGEVIVYGGAPNLGFSIAKGDSPINPLTLVEGTWPKTGEVVIDKSTAGKEDFTVGQTVGVQAEGPAQLLRISGIVKFGTVSTIGGATLAGFDLPTAQGLFDEPGQLDEIAVAAKPNVSDPELLRELSSILPPTAQVRTSADQARDDSKDTDEFISFLRGFLLAFAGIALFVGSFVIANSLSITIAQRTREFATLRTIGGSRRQVLWSIVLEAVVFGALACVTGLLLGLGLAKGLFWLFDKVGFTLPNSGLIFATRTIVVSLLVGILVTLLASLRPAVRATRVPPIAAVREGATLPESRFARFRIAGSAALTALGFAALAWGLFGPDLGTTQILLWMGLGALLVFFGVAFLSARIVRPLSAGVNPIGSWIVVVLSALVWPFATLPFWLVRYGAFTPASGARRASAVVGGVICGPLVAVVLLGLLALTPVSDAFRTLVIALAILGPSLALVVLGMWLRSKLTSWRPEWQVEFPGVLPDSTTIRVSKQNAQRNPQRTASTAAALMIGLALVSLVALLAAGITSTFRGAVNDLWGHADYAITAQNNFTPIPISVADAAAKAQGVQAVGNVRGGEAKAFDKRINATAVNPATASIFNIKWKQGSDDVLRSLSDSGAFVDDSYAESHNLRIGSPVGLTFANGEKKRLVVRGIFDPPTGGSPFGRVTMSAATWDRFNPEPRNLYSFVRMQGGQSDANRAALDLQLKNFPNAKVQTREQFIDNQISGLNSILNILYVLLALSVVVSLFGIVNTLVLTVFERTRELGMLRAIGMTRRQVRQMIRQESVITALIGGVLGIALGIVLAALLVARVEFISFSLPVVSLIVFTLAAIVVGIVAAIAPARRAARLNVLQALQYE
jgi:putative ABC transport system permease protein